MKHTPRLKPFTLTDARDRAGLTQLQLEELSGVDRTRISKMEADPDANPTIDTYNKLVTALRATGGLKADETLVFGPTAVPR